MKDDLSGIEVPRLVKKPGERKRVETLDDLKAALAEGWVLKLEPPAPDADLGSALTADLERQDAERDNRPTMPVDDAGPLASDEEQDAEPAGKAGKGGKKK